MSIAQLLASQAAVAIENMRLYDAARKGLRQAEALATAERRLGETVDPSEVCAVLAECIADVVHARVVTVSMRGRVVAAAGPGSVALVGRGERVARLESLLASTGAARVDDLFADPVVDRNELHEIAEATGSAPRAAMYAVLARHGATAAHGLVAVYDRIGGDAFDAGDLRMVTALAGRAAVALALADRVARESVARVLEAQEAERRRLARELHDETAQALGAVKFAIGTLASAAPAEREAIAEEARALVQSALADVRAIAVHLRPSLLDDFGLQSALEQLASQTAVTSGFAVRFTAENFAEDPPMPLALTIYRIAQEALQNVARHASASRVEVRLAGGAPGGLTLEVRDDGCGFDPAAVGELHLGLAGIRERVELLRGGFVIVSAPGAGTTVKARLPLP